MNSFADKKNIKMPRIQNSKRFFDEWITSKKNNFGS